MNTGQRVYLAAACVIVATIMLPRIQAHSVSARESIPRSVPAVQAVFNLDHPDMSPFPSDIFTVADHTHNTRRRVNLPYPDCVVRVSDCEDIHTVNTLDGFGLQPQLSIPFDGPIDIPERSTAMRSLSSISEARTTTMSVPVRSLASIRWCGTRSRKRCMSKPTNC